MFYGIGKQVQETTKLAFGMMKSELIFVIGLCLLTSLIPCLKVYDPQLVVSNIVSLWLIERLIQLSAFLAILERWRRKLGGKTKKITRFALLGLALWMLNSSFMFLANVYGFILFFLGTVLSYIWYFGLVVVYFGGTLAEAKNFVSNDKLLPCRIVGISAGIPLLWYGVLYILYPDGRELTSSIFAQGAWGIFWIISSYLTLAYFLLAKPKDFEPYLAQRLETISLQGKITSKNCITLAMIGGLLIAANTLRSLELPPSPSILIEDVRTEGNNVYLTLDLKDEVFKFTGFVPFYFSLRGGTGTSISKNPIEVRENSKPILFLKRKDRTKLELSFVTDRSGEGLTGLKDLYLWYKNVKLGQVVFNQPLPNP